MHLAADATDNGNRIPQLAPDWEASSRVMSPAEGFLLSRIDLPWDLELDTSLYYVGRVENQGVKDYIRIDTRIGWHPTNSLELSVVGQNLSERGHQEFGPSYTRLPSEVPRAVYGKVSWRY